MKRRRPGRFRMWLGRVCQDLAWWLSDPHDAWMVEWKTEDEIGTHTYAIISKGFYNQARAVAKSKGGRIVGYRCKQVPADGFPPPGFDGAAP